MKRIYIVDLKTNLLFTLFLATIKEVPGCQPTATTTPSNDSGSDNCCPALTQTPTTATGFGQGDMTFAYDSDICRTTVTASCAIPTGGDASTLATAIVANSDNFFTTVAGDTSTFPGTCVNGQWEMGTPAIVISTLECRLTSTSG